MPEAPRAPSRRHWLSDIAFHLDGSVTDRKTGQRVTAHELTLPELVKFLSYFSVVLVEASWRGARAAHRPKVCFLPDTPAPWYVVWSAAKLAGARFVTDPNEADAVFYFEDATLGAPPASASHRVINGAVTDITKTKVARAFEAVFGYPLLVDPQRHTGAAVEKSEANGRHDGRIIECPRMASPEKCYQRFVDGSDGRVATDYRTTIIAQRPRFVIVKTKPASQRFSIHNTSAAYAGLEDIFKPAELVLLEAFARALQLDWAAIDVLRDRHDGRLYVVDVNKTDTGPAVDLSLRDRAKVKAAIAEGFAELTAGARTAGFAP
jgi:hypothetical protein